MANANGKRSLMHPYGDCVYCGGEVTEHRVEVDYRYHGRLYILEDVPAGVCVQCGEQFFTAEVAKRMEAAVAGLGSEVSTVPVPVIAVG